MEVALHTRRPAEPSGSPLTAASCTSAEEVLAALRSGPAGRLRRTPLGDKRP
jgi:hypothetical protein